MPVQPKLTVLATVTDDNVPNVVLLLEIDGKEVVMPMDPNQAGVIAKGINQAIGESLKMLGEILARDGGRTVEEIRRDRLAAELEEYAKAHPSEGASC
jgi:predicted pyridoxine 5'-phosphate oxidase superfamily flavin-nucleotide-binding protein